MWDYRDWWWLAPTHPLTSSCDKFPSPPPLPPSPFPSPLPPLSEKSCMKPSCILRYHISNVNTASFSDYFTLLTKTFSVATLSWGCLLRLDSGCLNRYWVVAALIVVLHWNVWNAKTTSTVEQLVVYKARLQLKVFL